MSNLIRIANSKETNDYRDMGVESGQIVDITDPRDILLTEAEIKKAKRHSKRYYYLVKLIRNYELIHSDIYKESLHASQNELLQLNELICKESKPILKKQLMDAKEKCIKTISSLEKLCESKEEKEYLKNKDMDESSITQQFKHKG